MSDITIRMDDDVRRDAETLFEKLGLSMSSAVDALVRRAIKEQDVPIQVDTKAEKYNEYFTPQVIEKILESNVKSEQGDTLWVSLDELISMEDGPIPVRILGEMKKLGWSMEGGQ
jgi:DNA-damage-inducible protein J